MATADPILMQAHPLLEEESASLAGGALWDLSAPAAAQKQGNIRSSKTPRHTPLPAEADVRCAASFHCPCAASWPGRAGWTPA